MRNIVEAKVKTSSAAAAVTAFVASVVQPYLPDALAGTVSAAVTTVVAGAITFAAGWVTRHTPRVEVDATEPR